MLGVAPIRNHALHHDEIDLMMRDMAALHPFAKVQLKIKVYFYVQLLRCVDSVDSLLVLSFADSVLVRILARHPHQ
jgi:hypothetical protein